MSRWRRAARQALTIARRDFTATVFTPTFLFFLLSPIVMLSFGAIGGMGASTMATGTTHNQTLVAFASPRDAAALKAADGQLRTVFPGADAPPQLTLAPAHDDAAAVARAEFARKDRDASAVLYGPLGAPTVLYGAQGRGDARYLAAVAEAAVRIERSGGPAAASRATLTAVARQTTSVSGHGQSAFFTVFGMFFLTLLLAGQTVGTMAEERNNKVVEILAAAAPLEAVFLGKLIGMFGSAILFVIFWGTLITQIGSILPANAAAALGEIGPAMGEPGFAILFFCYFAMAYMLLGAVFLGVGAQATTPRELQMLSLPITITQVGMLALASRAASRPGSALAHFAEIFPLSSPFAMAAHAANSPDITPHLLALPWQLLWVAIAVTLGARGFRRGVLQSGNARRRRTIDNSVS